MACSSSLLSSFLPTSSPGIQSKTNNFLVVCERRSGIEALPTKRVSQRRKQGLVQERTPLKPGTIYPRLSVPDHIIKPPYVNSPTLPAISKEPEIHDAEGIQRMRAAGQLAARVLEFAGTLVKPSVTTDEIDKAVHEMIIDAGAYPSPLGYGGFPKSVCTSVNECMCHGIPASRPLEDGDIINIDVTVYLNGYHGDTSKTYLCGNVDEEATRLVKVTEECLYKGISVCKPGTGYKQIGKKISKLADKYGYKVDKTFVGHGVGRAFHAVPLICHFRNDTTGCMVAGQTFTIEPILVMGNTKSAVWDDNWTTVTADGSLAAQFEHTILITETGAQILTEC